MVAFPEAFIGGFPYWIRTVPPNDTETLYRSAMRSGIYADGVALRAILDIAATKRIVVSIGFNERSRESHGILWNSNVIIGPDGVELVHHRKLVPTFAEKLVYTRGDGA